MKLEPAQLLYTCGVPILLGFYFLLYGHRRVGTRPGVNPAVDDWHKRYGWLFKIVGPVMIVGGAARSILALSAKP